MARNVELKARVADLAAVERRARALADGPAERLVQRDVFFAVRSGRLKLRVFAGGGGELIHYHRPDAEGPAVSRYHRLPVADPAGLEAVLTGALGVRGVVRKERLVYLVGPTRIHLDRVEGLGSFLELEVVLDDGQTASDGDGVALDLLRRLGVPKDGLVAEAYVDLLERGA